MLIKNQFLKEKGEDKLYMSKDGSHSRTSALAPSQGLQNHESPNKSAALTSRRRTAVQSIQRERENSSGEQTNGNFRQLEVTRIQILRQQQHLQERLEEINRTLASRSAARERQSFTVVREDQSFSGTRTREEPTREQDAGALANSQVLPSQSQTHEFRVRAALLAK